MTQTRPLYGLADLPSDGIDQFPARFGSFGWQPIDGTSYSAAASGFDVATPTLASLGTSWLPKFGYDVSGRSRSTDSEQQRLWGNPPSGAIQTALLRGDGAAADAAHLSAPLVQKVSEDEIEPIRPGRPVQRKPLDAKPSEKHVWRPLQFDLPHYEGPEGVPERMIKLLNTPGLDDRMMEVIGAGKTMMNGEDWYDTDFLRNRFVGRFGQEVGTDLFLKFADFIAATSPGSDVGTNIRNASYYFNRWRRGEPLPSSSRSNRRPYGHWLGDQHIALLGMLLMYGALDPIRYPKITSFSQNLKRNELPPTMDVHALRLPAIMARAADFLKKDYRERVKARTLSMDEAVAHPSYWRGPYPNEVGPLRQLYKRIAPKVELSPGETQAGAWVGGGHITGVRSNGLWTFRQQFQDRIRRTAEEWGLTEEEVWDQFLDAVLDLSLNDDQSTSAA